MADMGALINAAPRRGYRIERELRQGSPPLRRADPPRHQARVLLDEAITSCRAMGMQLSLGQADAMRESLNG